MPKLFGSVLYNEDKTKILEVSSLAYHPRITNGDERLYESSRLAFDFLCILMGKLYIFNNGRPPSRPLRKSRRTK